MKKKIKLHTPRIPWDRAKRSIGIILLALGLEQADPLPFFKTPLAWGLYAWLLFEIVKQFLAWRLETSHEAVAQAERYKRGWTRRKEKVNPLSRYRLRRLASIIFGALAFGQVVNMFSERCTNALDCALLAPSLFIEATPLILQVVVGVAFGMLQFAAMFWYLSGVGFGKIVPPGTIDITFDDIYGQDKAKQRIVEVVDLLENDENIVKRGGHLPKGGLLTGPPGTGKTMLAKAAANRSTKPLILIPPGAFASTFIGINFLKVMRLGRWIRKQSRRYGGVFVFIDEIDSLGSRSGVEEGAAAPWFIARDTECAAIPYPEHEVVNVQSGGGMNMGTLEAFLSMIDGMEEPRGVMNKLLAFIGFKPLPPPKTRVFYLGATNRPGAVDPALKRAGRLGLEVRVDYPRYDGRLATYQGYLKKYKNNLVDDEISIMARNHFRGTGAEIEDVVNEALLLTFRDNEHPGVISFDDLMNAMMLKRWGESHGTFERDDNIHGVAVHEAGHALVMYKLLKHRYNIWFASIEQRGKTGGMVVPAPQDDDWSMTRDELISDVAVSLASRVAEELVLGHMSNGHGGDGPAATQKAENMVAQGHTFMINQREDDDEGITVNAFGQLGFTTHREAEQFHFLREQILIEAYLLASKVLQEEEAALRDLADLLEKEHTVRGDQIHKLFEEHGV